MRSYNIIFRKSEDKYFCARGLTGYRLICLTPSSFAARDEMAVGIYPHQWPCGESGSLQQKGHAGATLADHQRLMRMPDRPSLRDLPSVSALLGAAETSSLVERFGRQAATEALRAVLDGARAAIKRGESGLPSAADLVLSASHLLAKQDRSALRPAFNLTGIVLHTNLGRAVLAEAAIEAATAAMRDAVALEFDLATGKRGERDDHVRGLLCELTGAEDATVVNNNAAAVLLCLNTLANGREAIVSRGELIEIGGAFRMPDIMARAGAVMIEVGTTNRTHAKDYRGALNERTSVVLKVHTSNYRIQGFTAEVEAKELAAIAGEAKVP